MDIPEISSPKQLSANPVKVSDEKDPVSRVAEEKLRGRQDSDVAPKLTHRRVRRSHSKLCYEVADERSKLLKYGIAMRQAIDKDDHKELEKLSKRCPDALNYLDSMHRSLLENAVIAGASIAIIDILYTQGEPKDCEHLPYYVNKRLIADPCAKNDPRPDVLDLINRGYLDKQEMADCIRSRPDYLLGPVGGYELFHTQSQKLIIEELERTYGIIPTPLKPPKKESCTIL